MLSKEFLVEYVSPADLHHVKQYVDTLYNQLGLSLTFGDHFRDRVNDLRLDEPDSIKIPITTAEISNLLVKIYKKYGGKIAKFGIGQEILLTDMISKINIPIMFQWDGEDEEIDMITKTIMRKMHYKTHTPVLRA